MYINQIRGPKLCTHGPKYFSARHFTQCPRTALILASEDDSYQRCLKMKVSEIKAELDLRKVSYEGLFEKDEYARLLAEARASGRADPSIIEDFNDRSAQSSEWEVPDPLFMVARASQKAPRTPELIGIFTMQVGEASTPDLSAAADIVAGDGSLPGLS